MTTEKNDLLTNMINIIFHKKNLPKKIIKKVNRYLQQIVTAIIKQVSTVTLPHYSIFEFSGDLSPSLASW